MRNTICSVIRLVSAVLVTFFPLGIVYSQDGGNQRMPGNIFDQLYLRTQRIDTPKGPQFRVMPSAERLQRPSVTQINTFESEEEGKRNAAEYYSSVARVLGFRSSEPPANLQVLLDYLGYSGMSPKDLEHLTPNVLMDFPTLGNRVSRPALWKTTAGASEKMADPIVALRFFSPKTTDVSGLAKPVAYSWRKLVRFRALSNSLAIRNGVELAYVLTNIYETDLDKDPFQGDTPYFQVILTKRQDAQWPWPLCFMIFGPTPDGAMRRDYAETSWDAADTRLQSFPNRKYYVSRSCIQCHGDNTENAKLQYLDSDHWLDRIEPGDDFTAVKTSGFNSLFDVPAHDAAANENAHRLLRKLNSEIVAQNRAADRFADLAGAESTTFQTRAASNWLRLHASDSAHLAPKYRGIPNLVPNQSTPIVWNPGDANEVKLLTLLNRYCFRCHSSVKYHVFDKSMVLEKAGEMESYVESGMMPEDRILKEDDPDRLELIRLLKLLQAR